MMKSHDYVLALESCNTYGLSRKEALEQEKIAILPAYKSIETSMEICVLDGNEDIESFVSLHNLKEACFPKG